MERLRQARIREASQGTEPLTEREKLRFVEGVGLRTLQLLEESGYRTVQSVAQEDPDRLAIRAGLGVKKARRIQQAAQHFLQHEAREIDAARAAMAAQRQAAAAAAQSGSAAEEQG